MSPDSTMEADPKLNDASRTIVVTVNAETANEILKGFDMPVPDAADLDEIRLVIR